MNATVQVRVDEISWFPTINLGDGVITKGVDNSSEKLNTLGLPESMRGKGVLDVGAWDGFFCFEAERRGADVSAL